MGTNNYSHDQVERIFSEAQKLDSKVDRDAFLERECGINGPLRQDIESLLRVELEADSFLDRPAFEKLAVTESASLGDMSDSGESIGNYRLLQKLGEGGMGTVYMAEQTEPLNRRVAIKIVKPGMDSKQISARFEAERQALALMDHPNIAKVLDAGCTDDGKAYFVMELVKGIPITQFCDQNKLSMRQRLELFVPVCQAVQHAHQKGIIHRDLKPSNVIVALYDDRPVPKVIDFGVAKATNQRLTEKTLFTMIGQIVGTWEYMSPEQAVLNQLDVDTRSDVYSLGVLLYELLTGVPPIDPQRLRSSGLAETLRLIREEEPPKPSTRLSSLGPAASAAAGYRRTEPDGLIRSVRGDLDWVVMKAIDKDRTRRYQTPLEFAADIENHMSDVPVNARAPSTWYQFQKYAKRHRALLASVAAVILVMTVALFSILSAKSEAIQQREIAEKASDQFQNQNEKLNEAIRSLRESRAERILESALSGDMDHAEHEFRILELSHPSDSADTQLLLCKAIIDLFKSKAERTRARDRLVEIGTEDLAVHSLLVASHFHAGYEGDYWKEVSALVDREPQGFDEFLFRGFAFCWGIPDRAIEDLEEAKKRKPASAVTRVLLSNAYYRMAHHVIDRKQALAYAERAASEGELAKQILFQDSPFAVAQRIGANAKRLSLSKLLKHSKKETELCRDDLIVAMREAEKLPYDPQSHFALLAANLVLHPDTLGDRAQFEIHDSAVDVSANERVVVTAMELQHHYFNEELKECLRLLDQSKNEMIQSQSMVLLPDAESRSQSSPIEAIANDYVALLQRSNRLTPALNGNADWALLTLLGAETDAQPPATLFHAFLEQQLQHLQVAKDIEPVARYMSGDSSVDPEILLDHATTNRAVTGIAFWLGVDSLAKGHRLQAKAYFERAVEADFFELYDYSWSRIFLKRIEDPNWLPWLPNDHSLETPEPPIHDDK